MAPRVFVALAPAAVVAIVLGACSSALTDHPIADGGLPSAGGASGSSSATSVTSSSSSSSTGTTATTSATATTTSTSTAGTGGAASTSSTGAGGAGGGSGTGGAGCQGTDTNCGGNCPTLCVDGQHCAKGADCQSMLCTGGACVAATCTDLAQDGTETDIDCGGPSCPKCADGLQCGTMPNADDNCKDKICSSGICQPPTCTDGVLNGDESDIDCGGNACPPCNPGQKCNGSGDCVGNICSGTCQCPVGMVVAPIQGGGIYCIDANEVTYGEYQIFYDANVKTATQAPFCSWNTDWTPAANWPQPSQNAEDPVTNVNWCQAAAYCTYNGRRLCGKIGGGSIAQASFADFMQDQWYNACSAGGVNAYPYGSAYDPAVCNGSGGTLPFTDSRIQACLGGEPGLLAMSGNVAEWEDSCDGATGAADTCLIRGGSFEDGASTLLCNSGGTPVSAARNADDITIGFRCCL